MLERTEHNRLAALHELALLDTEPEPEFDDIVRLAAAICGVPTSVFSLIDQDRQWFKAAIGMQAKQMPRSIAFCDQTIQQSDLLVVEDAAHDPRFCTNPLVTGEAHLRFYAGMPIASPTGQTIGTLCVVDQQPRTLDEDQKATLRMLATQVSSRLELRLQRRQLEQALREKEQERAIASAVQHRFETFMNNSPVLCYIKDADGRMLYYNQTLATQFQVAMDAMLGKTNEELWPPEMAAVFRRNDQAVLSADEPLVSIERAQNAGGNLCVFKSYKFPCKDEFGNSLLGGVSIDITEQLQKQEELEQVHKELQQANLLLQQLASTDTLTGLAVRRIFDEELRLRFRTATQTGRPICVLLLDVDNFKVHNDQHGHPHGDRVLQALGKCLQTGLRPGDLVARYGGEEFAVLLSHESTLVAPHIVERLLGNIRAFSVDGLGITASAGLCYSGASVETTHQLVANADAALLAAKRAGKNRLVVYDAQSLVQRPEALRPVHPCNLQGTAATLASRAISP